MVFKTSIRWTVQLRSLSHALDFLAEVWVVGRDELVTTFNIRRRSVVAVPLCLFRYTSMYSWFLPAMLLGNAFRNQLCYCGFSPYADISVRSVGRGLCNEITLTRTRRSTKPQAIIRFPLTI